MDDHLRCQYCHCAINLVTPSAAVSDSHTDVHADNADNFAADSMADSHANNTADIAANSAGTLGAMLRPRVS